MISESQEPRDAGALRLAEELAKGPAFDPRNFRLWQEHGFHITPVHFYQPVPDTRRLKDSLWEQPPPLTGVEMNDAGQQRFLREVCLPYRGEYERWPLQAAGTPYQFHFDQYFFRMVDAEVLYCVIRHFRPSRIVEIGSGFSTFVAAEACRKNLEEGHKTLLTSIEPYPNDILRRGFPGLEALIEAPVEEADPAVFRSLGANDILFIDSSHVLRIGNDVHYEYLRLIPSVSPGVFIHIHDIFLPLEYPKEWVLNEGRFWNEQYLLQAFLAFNHSFPVVWAGCYMHCKYPDLLRETFPSYDPHTTLPGSFWMRRTGGPGT